MLAKWTEILPFFIFKWLAIKNCQRMTWDHGNYSRTFATARPDVFVVVEKGYK